MALTSNSTIDLKVLSKIHPGILEMHLKSLLIKHNFYILAGIQVSKNIILGIGKSSAFAALIYYL